MFSKYTAILLNSVFGVCLNYTVITIWFSLASNFVSDYSFAALFSLYNIVWLLSAITYNKTRYQKQGGGLFFWMSAILPPVLVTMILAGIIIVFF